MFKILDLFIPVVYATDYTTYAYGDSASANAGVNGSLQPDVDPTGKVFSDSIKPVYSKEIEYQALPLMVFNQFATMKTELMVQPGRTIEMLDIDDLTGGGAIEETAKMSVQPIGGSTKSITVKEFANAVSLSELHIRSSWIDDLAQVFTMLGRNYAKVLNEYLRDTITSTAVANVVFARDGETPVSSRTGLNANCTFKISCVKDAIEILATNNVPQYNGSEWICILSPHQVNGITSDPDWKYAVNYGDPSRVYNYEIGRTYGTRFIQTSLMPQGANAVGWGYKAELAANDTTGNAVPVYQAVLFGANFYALATSLPVEFRNNGVIDFNRTRQFGWYTILGAGLLHADYGVIIETA